MPMRNAPGKEMKAVPNTTIGGPGPATNSRPILVGSLRQVEYKGEWTGPDRPFSLWTYSVLYADGLFLDHPMLTAGWLTSDEAANSQANNVRRGAIVLDNESLLLVFARMYQTTLRTIENGCFKGSVHGHLDLHSHETLTEETP